METTFDSGENITSEGNNKIYKHKRQKLIRILLVIALIISLIVLFYYYGIKNRVYKSYSVIKTINCSAEGNVGFEKYKDGFIKYSPDGVSYYNGNKEVWNKSVSMTNPLVDVKGNYVVIAEKNSNTIKLFNETGEEVGISSTYPIVNVKVSKSGSVAAILDDGNAAYIETYTKNGDKFASGRTVLSGDGYPIDISVSEDGTKVVASYLAISSGTSQSKVVFYNFSEVGQNEVDRIVGGFNHYETTIVPDVEFINSNTVVAVGDNMYTIYSMDEKPKKIFEQKFDEKLLSVFYNSEYIGMVFESADTSGKKNIKIINTKGKEVTNIETEYIYNEICFNQGYILMYNSENITMYSTSAKKIFDKNYKGNINKVIPETKTTLAVIADTKTEIIKLK